MAIYPDPDPHHRPVGGHTFSGDHVADGDRQRRANTAWSALDWANEIDKMPSAEFHKRMREPEWSTWRGQVMIILADGLRAPAPEPDEPPELTEFDKVQIAQSRRLACIKAAVRAAGSDGGTTAAKIIEGAAAFYDWVRQDAPGAVVVEGYVLVPVIPTEQMIEATSLDTDPKTASAVWESMIDAAVKP